ncbi:MAG: hypothetical protein ABSG03_40785 [Bryobacteraceae bacterium]|jgi:hypothetical protein
MCGYPAAGARPKPKTAKGGRWGEGLTAGKMMECRWLAPSLVGQFEFVEWTPDLICGTPGLCVLNDLESREVVRES